MDKPLFQHQERDVQRILARPEEILNLSDPGCGKTRVHIEAIRRALEQGQTGKTLVFAPKSILQAAWGNDIDQFAPELRYVTAFADNREKAFKIDADVYLINHDGVNWFTERKGNGKYGLTSEARRRLKGFDRLIIDESTAFKSPTSQRSKSMQAVAEVMRERAVMTGTFTPNGLVDAWHQVYLVDEGKRLGAKFTQFRDNVCRRVSDKNDSRFSRWEDKPGIHPVVNELLKDITIRNKREDVLELPPNQVITVPFELAPRHRHYYEALLDEKLLELDSGTVSAFNAAVLVQKLLQVCIAEGTDVLTDTGWLPIQNVKPGHLLWDGHEWVSHGGLISQGVQPVINCYNILMTEDHRVLTAHGWRKACEVNYGDASTRLVRATVRLPDCSPTARHKQRTAEESHLAMPVRLRKHSSTCEPEPALKTPPKPKTLRLPTWGTEHHPQNDPFSSLPHLGQHERPLHEPCLQRLEKLRRPGHIDLRAMAALIRDILERYVTWLFRPSNTQSDKQRWLLLAGELPLGNAPRTREQHTFQPMDRDTCRENDRNPSSPAIRPKENNAPRPYLPLPMADRESPNHTCQKATYDILNVGRRNQFVIRGSDGAPLIVHNCSGAVYTREGEYQLLSNERTELILELAQSHKQALIAYTWQHQLDALIKAADKAKISYGMINGKVNDKYKERAVNEFQAGKLQLMFLHPASAAHGLTLTNATATIWASPTYNAEHYEQLNARFYRHGQTQKTITYLIAARNTLETQVYQKLKGKLSLMDILMSLIHQSQKKEAA